MNAPKPTATGTLAKTPVVNLLVYGLDRRLDGTLVVEHGGERSAVRFAAGVPIKVRLGKPVHLLGDLLIEMAGLSEADRDRAVATASQGGQLTGAVAVGHGVASAEDVRNALATQVARRLDELAMLPGEAVYGYYGGQDFLAAYGAPEGAEAVDALAVLHELVRRRVPEAHVEATLGRLGGRPLRLHRRARPARFGFDAGESAIIDLLRVKPYDVAGLAGAGVRPAAEVKRVLYTLALSRHLDLGAGALPLGVEVTAVETPSGGAVRARTPPRPPTGQAAARRTGPRPAGESPTPGPAAEGASPAPAAAAPVEAELTEEQAAFRDELERRVATIGSQNYYEILGVDPKADVGTIRSAFFQLAKQWHPDRIPRALAQHKEAAAKIFSRMTEAHQILSNDEQRAEYDQLMKEGGATADEQEQVQKILRAATAFQKAGVYARKNNLAEAEREAKLACEWDPAQAEYSALYAELLARQPGRTDFDEPIRRVNEAKKAEENNLRIRMHRARVLQRAGQARAALAEFQFVAEEDSRNVEAAREVRLYRMRQGQASADKGKPEKSGIANQDIGELFGRFFKR